MKERITITINDDLLRAIDSQVDGTTIKNRSHAIELALSKTILNKRLTQAVILAGGTYEVKQDGKTIPTLLAKVNGTTIIEHNIRLLKKHGITDIIISLYHRKDDIKKLLGDGTSYGVRITYLEEDQPLGTAGALLRASEYIRGPFVVTNGDSLKDIDIREVFDFHKHQGTLATIALSTANDPSKYGVIVLNGTRVHSFIEKPQSNIPSNLINAGLYIFDPEVFKEFPADFGKLETDVFPKLAQKDSFAGFVSYGKCNFIRSKEELDKAIHDW